MASLERVESITSARKRLVNILTFSNAIGIATLERRAEISDAARYGRAQRHDS